MAPSSTIKNACINKLRLNDGAEIYRLCTYMNQTQTKLLLNPIGIIHSPFTEKDQPPIQASRSKVIGLVELIPVFAEGLKDIEGFSHIFLLYNFHRSSGYSLHVKPFLDDHEHGLFTTRHPCRPNPIGLSIVQLIFRQENYLTVEGVDVLDGTPLLDIKPYVPEFDAHTDAQIGWFETRSKK
jgi:tRNA-Thr(GGU) m(6)t(6)A37 methyltransferase TsaA